VAAAREQDAALNYGKKFNASNKGSYYGFQERKHKDLVFFINFLKTTTSRPTNTKT